MSKPYSLTHIKEGDETSAALASLFDQTLGLRSEVEVLSSGMHGLKGLRLNKRRKNAVAIIAGGDPNETDMKAYGASLIDNLVKDAEHLQLKPVAMTNVIDSWSGKFVDIQPLAEGMLDSMFHYKIPNLNGEFAKLGVCVRDVNATGILICEDPKGHFPKTGSFSIGGTQGVVFNHNGKFIYGNTDGTGTKPRLNVLRGNIGESVNDFTAMNADDVVKLAGTIVGLLGLVEHNGRIDTSQFESSRQLMSNYIQAPFALDFEDVGSRLNPYRPLMGAYNISGGAISLIDEERLKKLPAPKEGEYIMYVQGSPNPRSNGLTAIRDGLEILAKGWEKPGVPWYKTMKGNDALHFFSEPSVVLYPIFKALLEDGIVSSVGHMSGGGFRGKLAKPLAKHGLYAELHNLPDPDPRQIEVGKALGSSVAEMYESWPMRVDGYVTTSDPRRIQMVLDINNLNSEVMGQLQRVPGKKGVDLYTPLQKDPISYLFD